MSSAPRRESFGGGQSPLTRDLDMRRVARRVQAGKCRRRFLRSAVCLFSFVLCVGSVLVRARRRHILSFASTMPAFQAHARHRLRLAPRSQPDCVSQT